MQKKKLIAGVILLVGAGVAFNIFSGGFGGDSSGSLISFLTSEQNGAFASESRRDAAKNFEGENITDNVVRAYGLEILKMNPQGQGSGSPIIIPEDTIFDSIVDAHLDQKVPMALFTEKDIRVGTSSAKEDALAYLAAVGAAGDTGGSSSNFYTAVATFIDKGVSDELESHISRTATHINTLLSLTVPPDWKSFHLDMLNLWQKRLTLANTILKNTEDPIKTVIALNDLSSAYDAEQELYLTLLKYMEAENL